MCGRYTLTLEERALLEFFDAIDDVAIEPWIPSWNLAPTQRAPVIGVRDGARVLRAMRWGLVPSWTKTTQDAKETAAKCINARSESVGTKPSFRAAFAKRRCLVPASGWYEWKVSDDARERRKTPHYLTSRDGHPVALAGLWEAWKNPETQEDLRTFSVLTCEPNALVAQVHDRMPVILSAEGAARWLDATTPASELHALLVPSPAEALVAWEVGRAVGNVRSQGAELIEPVRVEERAA